jgi:predicted MarR family transcription regulator
MQGITRMERLVLANICIATFQDVRLARRALKKLISGGYVARYPTAGEMTYKMTQAGWEECRRMKDEAPRS